jgi:predicted membrane metal-binding protein
MSKLDRTKDKDKFQHMLKGWIDQFAHTLVSSDTKNYIQQLVIEPFLHFIFERAFPYLLIAICVFSAMLIIIILIFVLLIMNHNKVTLCPFCKTTF